MAMSQRSMRQSSLSWLHLTHARSATIAAVSASMVRLCAASSPYQQLTSCWGLVHLFQKGGQEFRGAEPLPSSAFAFEPLFASLPMGLCQCLLHSTTGTMSGWTHGANLGIGWPGVGTCWNDLCMHMYLVLLHTLC
jgi:hypothetical protein